MEKSIPATEANRGFSRILREVRAGDSFVVTDRGRPVARIVPVSDTEAKRLAAREALLQRVAGLPAQNIPPWTRDELYEDDDAP